MTSETPLALNSVHIGDAREMATRLAPGSIQTIVTSPPYMGLRSYLPADHPAKGREMGTETTPDEYVAALVALFAALRPGLRDDGSVWLNLGDSYNAYPGNRGTESQYAGKRHLMEPDFPSGYGLLVKGLKQKDLVGVPWRVAFALQAGGWYLRSDIIWHKPNPMPESVADRPTRSHEYLFLLTKRPRYYFDALAIAEPYADGSASRVAQPSLDTQQGGYKTEAYQQDHPGKKARDRRPADILRAMRDNGRPGRNKRDVWTVPTQPYPGAHFATFPPELIRPCIRAGTSEYGACAACGAPWRRKVETNNPSKAANVGEEMSGGAFVGRTSNPQTSAGLHRNGGGVYSSAVVVGWEPSCRCGTTERRPCVVLDPFCGSGTTPMVAVEEGRDWLGFDLDPRSVEWTANRLRALPVRSLFAAGGS